MYEQRAKLLFELGRAQVSAAVCRRPPPAGRHGYAWRVHTLQDARRVPVGCRIASHSVALAAITPFRVQARAAATAGTANEVTGIAQIAQREVVMLQGQLADLDRKNKLAVRRSQLLSHISCPCALPGEQPAPLPQSFPESLHLQWCEERNASHRALFRCWFRSSTSAAVWTPGASSLGSTLAAGPAQLIRTQR